MKTILEAIREQIKLCENAIIEHSFDNGEPMIVEGYESSSRISINKFNPKYREVKVVPDYIHSLKALKALERIYVKQEHTDSITQKDIWISNDIKYKVSEMEDMHIISIVNKFGLKHLKSIGYKSIVDRYEVIVGGK